jgi:glycosyltransferase involved in cell wall biosynthesis
VSVGVPVYNEAASLESAVHDLLRQTHPNIEVVISDNASLDDTESIARRLEQSDTRVVYVRQPHNIGAAANFRDVLRKATGEFFMWAAADDRWDPAYVERNLANLNANPRLVGSVSKVRWAAGGASEGLASGTGPLQGTSKRKVARYLRYARDNSRFYGLYRREVLVGAYPDMDFFAIDIATMLGTLTVGDHGELDEVLMTRRRNDPATYVSLVDVTAADWLSRWFPMLPCTRYALRDLRIPLSPVIVAFLVARNVYDHFRYAAQHRSVYGSFARLVMRGADPLRARTVDDRS